MKIILNNNEEISIEKSIIEKSKFLQESFQDFGEITINQFTKKDFENVIHQIKLLADENDDLEILKCEKKYKFNRYTDILKNYSLKDIKHMIKIADFLDFSYLFQVLCYVLASLKNDCLVSDLNNNILTNIIEYFDNEEIEILSEKYGLDPFYYKQTTIEKNTIPKNFKNNYMNVLQQLNLLISYRIISKNYFLLQITLGVSL